MLLSLPLLFAQAGLGFDIGHIAIIIIVIAAIVGIVYVGLRQAGVAIPGFVVQVFWIVICAIVCIFAIKFLMSAI